MVAGASISVAHGVVSKDGVSDQKGGWNESPINWDGFASKDSGSPFQPVT